MRLSFQTLLFIFILILEIFSADSKNVLYINSYHPSFIGTQKVAQGVWEEFSKTNYNLYTEYLDTKRFSSPEHLQKVQEYLNQKYQNKKIDCIITADDHALSILLKDKSSNLYKPPLVFCGINHLDAHPIHERGNITGIREEFDPTTSFNLIGRMHPHLKTLNIVIDSSKTGKLEKKRLEKSLISFKPSFKIKYIENWTFKELKETLENLPENEVVFSITMFVDKEGKSKGLNKIAQMVKSSNVPIYGGHDVKVGLEIAGGSVVSLYKQGVIAARFAKEILLGKSTKDIPIDRDTSLEFIFDYQLLKKHNINLNLLPDETKFINNPKSLYEIYKNEILFSLLFIIILICVIIFLIRNIAKRKEVEEQLSIAIKEMKQANQVKSEFLSVVSHELRTPLNPILGMSEILLDQTKDDPETQECLEIIRNCCKNMQELVDDVLAFNQLEYGKTQLQNDNVRMDEFSSFCILPYENLAHKKGLEYKVEGLDSLNQHCLIDRVLLKRVIQSLLSNAIKFTQNGFIKVNFSLTPLNSKQVSYKVIVEDSGCGLKEDDFKKVIEPFSQLDASITRAHGGTGLGLSICDNITNLLGGTLSLDNSQNNGCKFIVDIPIYKNE